MSETEDRRPSLLQLIGRFLKSGIMEEGKYFETEMGTPQGGVLSPVLANVYLHYARDLWFGTEVLPQLTGFARLVRYADDFVVCFEKEVEARGFGDALRQRMGEFGLTISEEKSEIIEFGRCPCTRAKRYGRKCETFDFLGFTQLSATNPDAANSSLGGKTSLEEVQTEDGGYEYMVEAYPKSCRAESMVECAGAKVAWTLPLLRK